MRGNQISLPTAVMITRDPLTFSSAVSLARTSPTPDCAPVWAGIDQGSGSNLTDALASFDRASSSWRTSQGSLLEELTKFSDAWPREGMTRNGQLYERPMLVRPIAELECSSWPTPSANQFEGDEDVWRARRDREKAKGTNSNGFGLTLAQKVQEATWPTHRSEDSESSGERVGRGTADTLTSAVRTVREIAPTGDWATPQARDARGITQGVSQGDYTDALPDQLAGLHDQANHNTAGNPRASSNRPVLNPRWVLCLMGFPATWLDGIDSPPAPRSKRKQAMSSLDGDGPHLLRSVTPSSRTLRKSSHGASVESSSNKRQPVNSDLSALPEGASPR